MEENQYLQPDFNPSSCKVVELRNILLQNDVSYPSHAKKQDLIDLFNENVKPQAARKLKELENVIATEEGIINVDKKRRSPRKLAKKEEVEIKPEVASETRIEQEKEKDKAPRRSPRKVSKSKKVVDSKADETIDAKRPKSRISSSTRTGNQNLGEIPKLSKDEPRKRERRTTRESSPSRTVSKTDISKRERSPRRRVTQVKKEKELETKSDRSSVGVTDEEKAERSSFKFDTKLESSFTSDNVFQASDNDSPKSHTEKTIPKKRSNDNEIRKKKSKLHKSIKKTAFSSSPEPVLPKSPVKKSLEILKFETSSSPSEFLSKEMGHDIFNHKSEEFPESSTNAQLDSQITPISKKVDESIYTTPSDGNYSESSIKPSSKLSSEKSQPAVFKRRSLLPDFSKLNVSKEFAKTLGITIQGDSCNDDDNTNKAEQPGEEDDSEVLNDDSDLLNLQKDIESTNSAVLAETEEAVKRINTVFNDEDTEQSITESLKQDLGETSKDKVRKTSNWEGLLKSILAVSSSILVFLLFVIFVTFSLWYREQRVFIGYCGLEIDVPTFPNTENKYLEKLNEILDDLKPACLPCPENAICFQNLQIKCTQDYVIHKPWYKFYDVFPFSDYCIYDDEKEKIINEMVSKSLDLLRIKNAETSCGDGDDFTVGLTDEELYEFFFNSKTSISDEEFNDLWRRVVIDLENEPEITTRYAPIDNSGFPSNNLSADENEDEKDIPKEPKIFRSHSLLNLSIRCKFQKEVYDKFYKHGKLALSLIVVLFATLVTYNKILSYKRRLFKINEISDIILIKLQKQKQTSIKDVTGLTNRYLNNIQLRDELLASSKNNQKFKIWDSVLSRLEKNSNIRSSTKEIHGEIVKVLEWIGD